MALTGAQRVQRHRVKQRARIEELEAENERLTLANYALTDRVLELSEKNANLRTANKRVWTMYRNARDANFFDFGAEFDYGGNSDRVDWDYLAGLSDSELRKWVKIGRRVDRQEGQDAIHTATEWLKGNAPVLANAGVS